LEHLLGLRREGDRLRFAPCIPPEWKSFKVHYRVGKTTYDIELQAEAGWQKVKAISVDGEEQSGDTLPLKDDGQAHQVKVMF
ncbi:MAG: glycosyl hydrolase family 65 protein, partial [Limisphaerales bacterium]